MIKDLEYYMSLPYRIEIIKDTDEEGYAVFIPELKGCITTGTSIPDALESLEDAKKTWLSSAIEDGVPIPEAESVSAFRIHYRRDPSEDCRNFPRFSYSEQRRRGSCSHRGRRRECRGRGLRRGGEAWQTAFSPQT